MIMQRLRNARVAAGLTQEEMGKRLGLTMAGYRQKEVGERKIYIDEANKIAAILNVTLNDLFFEDKKDELQNHT